MSIIDIIKQKREEKFIKKINLGKSSKEEIIKGFEKLVNKEKFISHIYEYLYVNDEVAEALKDKVIEMSKNDKDFLVNNAMKLPMVGLNFDETKEIIKSCFSAEEIVSDIELFSLYGYDYDKNVLMQSVDNKLVSFEVL